MFSYRDFKKTVEEKNYKDAVTLIASIYHAHPNNLQYLKDYVIISEKLVGDISNVEYKKLISDLDLCIDKYRSQVKLNRLKLSELKELELKVQNLKDVFYREDLRNIEKQKDEIKLKNADILNLLSERLISIDSVATEDEFNLILNSVRTAEVNLDVTSMSDEERIAYDTLIDNYANKIQQLTDKFNQIALKEYNLMAIESLHEVYEEFIKNKRKIIKHFAQFKPFLVEKFLSIDVNKLYREANEYYNYVYSYIFNRLDNDDKYTISKLVLEVNKK